MGYGYAACKQLDDSPGRMNMYPRHFQILIYRSVQPVMKIVAMYLPQFHQVRENDEWWGEGFTDWVTVKNAKALYEGHEQPKVPWDNNYYDLTDKQTMAWQADLMKEYGVDGMCMYHYWFKDGRRILEKPAENLLQWADIDMPFCFCWANETWARSWSNVRDKNVWANTLEKERRGRDDGILLEQKYGEEERWEEHFNYLLPFFKDRRYMRIDGKPVFVIYRSAGIPCIGEMLKLWRKKACENGLEGLYVIGAWAKERSKRTLDAELYHEPSRARFAIGSQNPNSVTKFDYDAVWGKILESEGEGKTFFGGFVSYDDTPRRGQEGHLIEGASPDRFCHYLMELMAKNEAHGNEMIFLNAWNEWGEGMYLEPDIRYRYGFLEAVRYAKKYYKSQVAHYGSQQGRYMTDQAEMKKLLGQKEKFGYYLNLLDEWMSLREKGVRLSGWLLEKNFREIGVYGYGMLGRHFLKELENEPVKVRYLIDQKKNSLHASLPVYLPGEKLPEADAVVVTAVFYFDEICRELERKGIRNIVSLEQIIEEI